MNIYNLFKRPSNRINKGIYEHPLPLYSPKHKLALFWSAKAGCTFAVKWFLFQIGELDLALEYDPWIHNFRENIFYNKPNYRESLNSLSPDQTKIIKVVRNPFSRAVSSYLMAVRAGYENEALSRFLNRKVDDKNGFSFEEFIDYLESIDLRTCNIHHRIQTHTAEENGFITPHFVIKLENSLFELRKCEKALRLKKADLNNIRKSGHNTYRREWTEYWGAVKFYRHLGSKMLPGTHNFYNDRTEQKVLKLYKIDIDNYHYDFKEISNNLFFNLKRKPENELLTQITNQFPADGPIEFTKKALGYFKDSWCTKEVVLEFEAKENISNIQFVVRLPGEVISTNEIQIECNEIVKVFHIKNTSDQTLCIDAKLHKGETHKIIIKCGTSFNCKNLGISQDSRELSFYLIQALFL